MGRISHNELSPALGGSTRRRSHRFYVASPPMPPLTAVLDNSIFVIDRQRCGERDQRPRAGPSGELDAWGDAEEGGGA